MGLWERIFGKRHRPSSKDVARERLELILIHDRTDISPTLLETLRQEIIDVISKHVIVDEAEGIEVTITQTRGRSRLQATIPLLGTRRRSRVSSGRSSSRSRAKRRA